MPRMQATNPSSSSLMNAYQHCLDIAQSHYENFPTASRLLRADLRPAVAAIYAFARHADDLADEGDAPASQRLKQLEAWATLLEYCREGRSVDHPIFIALGDTIRQHQIDADELDNLLTAFRMDVSIHGYASWNELLFYCKHSANPVGRLMLQLHQVRDARAYYLSDNICSALQLINFWQDLSIDLPRGRCYIPEEWLQESSLCRAQLLQGHVDEKHFQTVFNRAIRETRAMLDEGSALLAMLPWRLRLQIAATLHAGYLMLAKLEAQHSPLQERPVIHPSTWLKLLFPIIRDTLSPPKAKHHDS